jgi:hypothetical protein
MGDKAHVTPSVIKWARDTAKMVLIPLLLWLYWPPAHKPAIRSLAWVVVWYIVAKILEALDRQTYDLVGISGHTLKHLAAAVSTMYFVQLFGRRYRGLGSEAIAGGKRAF